VPRDVDLDLDSSSVMSSGFEWEDARGAGETPGTRFEVGERESVLLEIALDQFPDLSLTLPTSPLDLETVIGMRWEELSRSRDYASAARPEIPVGTTYGMFFDDMEDEDDEEEPSQPVPLLNPPQEQKRQKLQKQQRRFSRRQLTTTPTLRSKWSSSTLASGANEEERGENEWDGESASSSRGFRFTFRRQKKAKPAASPLTSPTSVKRVPLLPSPVDLPSVFLQRSPSMKSVESAGKRRGS
jgi:hypothetical protein